MTRYSRSVIPGRSAGEPLNKEIESLVFGKKGRSAPANDADDDDDDFDDDEADHLVERATSDRRGKERRRPKSRRKSDFAPLPQEGRGYVAPEGSKRGPILLVGALVIVAVFSVVVWNAYREGVRPSDSNTAPQLAEAGAFKSKPDPVAGRSAAAVEASVFEQVEAPRPTITPAPEVRAEPPPPAVVAAAPPPAPLPLPTPATTVVSAPKPAVKPPTPAPAPVTTQTTPAATKPAPPPIATQPAATQPAATQPAATKPPATPAPAVTPPVQTAAAPAPKPAPKPAATEAAQPKSEAISLIGSADYIPVFVRDGKYLVQIAAASTEAGADAEWAKRVKATPELFAGSAEKIIVQADVNGRTVYRVRAGAFATAVDADAFCSAIKAKGGACFRTTR
jgi:SPOR domain